MVLRARKVEVCWGSALRSVGIPGAVGLSLFAQEVIGIPLS
jgi:hypothetical protein